MAPILEINLWQLVGIVLVAVILIFGISSGIEKVNKVMMHYFLHVCWIGNLYVVPARFFGWLPIHVFGG